MSKKMDGDISLAGTVSQEEYRKLLPQETVSSLLRFENIKNRSEVKIKVPRFGVNSQDPSERTNAWIIATDGVVTPSQEAVSESTETAFEESC